MPDAIIADITVRCNICTRATLFLPRVHLGGGSIGERFDTLSIILPPRGWAVWRNVASSRDLVCPECAEKLAIPTALPQFATDDVCPKCGCPDVGTRFCNGRTPNCPLMLLVDHQHRECTRCKFEWPCACKDWSPVVARGVFRFWKTKREFERARNS